ncbi:MAG: tRNA uridine-5-carboxymethylaminomethyl(34) synthesis GTPase MnmE [Lachnospiraceae bacterium]|nr:tRNA uridine-5-carboxymethylaminomethyl(34) synthesis GTPase MnmE [Lachnospiraceae bacterium]
MNNDTIAGIATALSESGIGIIRVSGDDAIKIVNSIFVNKKGEHTLASFSSHTIHYGFIVFDGQEIDEVMVSVMKAPNSFTKEDVVEINCHGGVFVCKSVLEAVLSSGARLCEPGEFTKRAFLNGRIDLSKAEAVMDVISSSNNSSLNNSLKHLNGNLYKKIKDLRDRLIYEIAFIESALDDPEHISLEGYPQELLKKCIEMKEETDRLKESFKTGKILKDGIDTVILGKPNVGKSSLLNMLSGEDRAIVTDIAGTTRDTIEERVILGDVVLNLTDTAGIRESEDLVENIGVNKAKDCAKKAELVLLIIDSTTEITDEDKEIIELVKDKKLIVLINKIDMPGIIRSEDVEKYLSGDYDIVEISAKEGTGIRELSQKIYNRFLSGSFKSDEEIVITNLRQAEELKTASDSLNNVTNSINMDLPEDFYSIDLMNAYAALGRIIGEDVDDDLVNEIFSKFCMGK